MAVPKITGAECDVSDFKLPLDDRSICLLVDCSRAAILADSTLNSSSMKAGTVDLLDFRGGRSNLVPLMGFTLGTVDTLLTPRECPGAVEMVALL